MNINKWLLLLAAIADVVLVLNVIRHWNDYDKQCDVIHTMEEKRDGRRTLA